MRADGEHATAAAPGDWHARPSSNPDALPEADSLPGYRLAELIHRGGQGAVYRAVQLSTGREVAVKVLPGGRRASDAERRRFERECDLVAVLDHPNVVALIDRGESAGQPYFAMRLVDGDDLDAWARSGKPSIAEKLHVFLQVCDGVAHAHQRGVIHRDLKPRNIRVDAAGQAHVLDFGLGKPFDSLTGPDASSLTLDGHFVGTLAFAAPEQLSGDHSRIDVRTDVYALGLILYWLLAGRMPYPVDGEVSDVLRAVQLAEPAPLRGHDRSLDRDLEVIALKALAKEPARRYATVDALAADLRRHLASEPIEARRDSRWYVLRRMARRHRAGVAVAVAFLALLAAGAVAVVHQRNEALRQAELADARAGDLARMLPRLRREMERARTEAESAERISRVLSSLLNAGPQGQGDPRELRVIDQLDRARETILPELSAEPLIQARVALAIASAYRALGSHAQAAQLSECVAPLVVSEAARPADRIDAMRLTAMVLKGSGDDPAGAEALYRRAADLARRHDAELPPAALPASLGNLATTLLDGGKHEDASAPLEEALDLAFERLPDNKLVLGQLTDRLSYLRQVQGRMDEYFALKPVARTLLLEHFAGPNVIVAGSLSSEALSLVGVGRPLEAERLARESVAMFEALGIPGHVQAAEARNHLGLALQGQGRFDEAERELRESLRIFRASAGERTGSVGILLTNLAELEEARGNRRLAAQRWADVLAWREAGPGSPPELIAHARTKVDELSR